MEYVGYVIAFFTVIGSVWGAFSKVRKIEKAFDDKIKAEIKNSKELGDRIKEAIEEGIKKSTIIADKIKAAIKEYDEEESEKRTLRSQKYDQQFKDHAEEVSRFIKKQVITDSELNGARWYLCPNGTIKN